MAKLIAMQGSLFKDEKNGFTCYMCKGQLRFRCVVCNSCLICCKLDLPIHMAVRTTFTILKREKNART